MNSDVKRQAEALDSPYDRVACDPWHAACECEHQKVHQELMDSLACVEVLRKEKHLRMGAQVPSCAWMVAEPVDRPVGTRSMGVAGRPSGAVTE
ncbi:hypothetical protein GCM10009663_70590 [Kitasatospora arboriphila]|uniref:Uncharacterized protein n=1 Tax=Kitasatospora arboriphila TaxID=258052 RepID=A0ABN1U579_9ACTN